MIHRRQWLKTGLAGFAGVSGWLPALAAASESENAQRRHCILLWMSGGPSQIDTFDMKPDHANGGTFKEAATKVPGIRFSEHLPKLAERADSLAILRGVSTKEGDHERGTVLMRTGHVPGGPVRYPSIGSSLSKSLGTDDSELPSYVTIAPGPFAANSTSPGFLGAKYAATSVSPSGPVADAEFAQLKVEFLNRMNGVSHDRHQTRLELWRNMQKGFLQNRAAPNVIAHDTTYQSAIRSTLR